MLEGEYDRVKQLVNCDDSEKLEHLTKSFVIVEEHDSSMMRDVSGETRLVKSQRTQHKVRASVNIQD